MDVDKLAHLAHTVKVYRTARTELTTHPHYEDGTVADRYFHARDDAAVQVADAVDDLLRERDR